VKEEISRGITKGSRHIFGLQKRKGAEMMEKMLNGLDSKGGSKSSRGWFEDTGAPSTRELGTTPDGPGFIT